MEVVGIGVAGVTGRLQLIFRRKKIVFVTRKRPFGFYGVLYVFIPDTGDQGIAK
jgi:hypothetical protein